MSADTPGGMDGAQIDDTSVQTPVDAADVAAPRVESPLYTPQFLAVFLAVVLFMTGVALQFHFGEFVQHLGHSIDTLGWILGVSTIGTLLIRLQIGRGIDRFGCKPTWIVGCLSVVTCALLIQFASALWIIVLLRTAWAMAIATVMTTVAVFAAQVAPRARRAESLGSMGMSGFLGMMIGSSLGDWIFSGDSEQNGAYYLFFCSIAAFAMGACLIIIFLQPVHKPEPTTSSLTDVGDRPIASAWRYARDYAPLPLLAIGIVFSMTFSFPSIFLERMADARGFHNIKVFFLFYGTTAIVMRVIFRRAPQIVGRNRILLIGMGFLATGVFVLSDADSQFGLIAPGLLMGAGHCFAFPSMVDLGAERFPQELRGLGTSLILGAGDAGMLTGFVVLGWLIEHRGFNAAFGLLVWAMVTASVILCVARRRLIFHRGAEPSD